MTEANQNSTELNPRKSFAADFAKVQAKIGRATKDKKNSHFGSKYADLASVFEAWQEAGPEHGFSVLQLVKDAGEGRQGILLETILLHRDGMEVSSTSFFPAVKGDAQAYGSALTYARRYALAAMVGVCPDDDDGNAASGRAAPKSDGPPPDFTKLAESALTKHAKDPAKLQLLYAECVKVGATDLANRVNAALEAAKGK